MGEGEVVAGGLGKWLMADCAFDYVLLVKNLGRSMT